jgi:hypothetical protein
MSRKYYNGDDDRKEELQELPPYPECGSGGCLYVLRVGSAHSEEGKRCGISKTYLLPGLNSRQAIASFLVWCRAVVDEVRSNMSEDDLADGNWDVSTDVFGARVKRVKVLEHTISETEDELAGPAIPWARGSQLRQRLRESKDERNVILRELEPKTEVNSRFELIVKPLRQVISWLEQEHYDIQRVPTDLPIPVSRFGDWYGFTSYQKKELML